MCKIHRYSNAIDYGRSLFGPVTFKKKGICMTQLAVSGCATSDYFPVKGQTNTRRLSPSTERVDGYVSGVPVLAPPQIKNVDPGVLIAAVATSDRAEKALFSVERGGSQLSFFETHAVVDGKVLPVKINGADGPKDIKHTGAFTHFLNGSSDRLEGIRTLESRVSVLPISIKLDQEGQQYVDIGVVGVGGGGGASKNKVPVVQIPHLGDIGQWATIRTELKAFLSSGAPTSSMSDQDINRFCIEASRAQLQDGVPFEERNISVDALKTIVSDQRVSLSSVKLALEVAVSSAKYLPLSIEGCNVFTFGGEPSFKGALNRAEASVETYLFQATRDLNLVRESRQDDTVRNRYKTMVMNVGEDVQDLNDGFDQHLLKIECLLDVLARAGDTVELRHLGHMDPMLNPVQSYVALTGQTESRARQTFRHMFDYSVLLHEEQMRVVSPLKRLFVLEPRQEAVLRLALQKNVLGEKSIRDWLHIMVKNSMFDATSARSHEALFYDLLFNPHTNKKDAVEAVFVLSQGYYQSQTGNVERKNSEFAQGFVTASGVAFLGSGRVHFVEKRQDEALYSLCKQLLVEDRRLKTSMITASLWVWDKAGQPKLGLAYLCPPNKKMAALQHSNKKLFLDGHLSSLGLSAGMEVTKGNPSLGQTGGFITKRKDVFRYVDYSIGLSSRHVGGYVETTISQHGEPSVFDGDCTPPQYALMSRNAQFASECAKITNSSELMAKLRDSAGFYEEIEGTYKPNVLDASRLERCQVQPMPFEEVAVKPEKKSPMPTLGIN